MITQNAATSVHPLHSHVMNFSNYEEMGYALEHLECYIDPLSSEEREFDGTAPFEVTFITEKAISQKAIKKMMNELAPKSCVFNTGVDKDNALFVTIKHKRDRCIGESLACVVDNTLDKCGVTAYCITKERTGYRVWGSSASLLKLQGKFEETFGMFILSECQEG